MSGPAYNATLVLSFGLDALKIEKHFITKSKPIKNSSQVNFAFCLFLDSDTMLDAPKDSQYTFNDPVVVKQSSTDCADYTDCTD